MYISNGGYMNNKQNPHLTGIAQHLRKNMTPEERHLWFDFLKGLPITFNRQKVIGNFVVDFYSAEARIVIEIDGSQHLYGEGKEKDIERDTLLKELGIIVLRYTNFDIHDNFRGVCTDILKHISSRSDWLWDGITDILIKK